jgi:TRAP-type mannitol/chloroaromatic compound transport system substrate-binding protein
LPPVQGCVRSRSILDACYKASQELFAKVSAKNAAFKNLYDSTTAFRNDQYAWNQICETTYDACMIRQRSRT